MTTISSSDEDWATCTQGEASQEHNHWRQEGRGRRCSKYHWCGDECTSSSKSPEQDLEEKQLIAVWITVSIKARPYEQTTTTTSRMRLWRSIWFPASISHPVSYFDSSIKDKGSGRDICISNILEWIHKKRIIGVSLTKYFLGKTRRIFSLLRKISTITSLSRNKILCWNFILFKTAGACCLLILLIGYNGPENLRIVLVDNFWLTIIILHILLRWIRFKQPKSERNYKRILKGFFGLFDFFHTKGQLFSKGFFLVSSNSFKKWTKTSWPEAL